MQSKPQKGVAYERMATRTSMQDERSRQPVSFQTSTTGGQENVMDTLSSAEGTTLIRNVPRNMQYLVDTTLNSQDMQSTYHAQAIASKGSNRDFQPLGSTSNSSKSGGNIANRNKRLLSAYKVSTSDANQNNRRNSESI